MRALIVALVAGGIACGAALLAMGCTDENPDFAPYFQPCEGGSCPPRQWSAPDLASETCGLVGDPCCLDVHGRAFCTVGACYAGRCGVPDLAAPPDMCPPGPDLTWRPDLTGGQCVGRCGACSGNYQCCTDPQEVMNCLDSRGFPVQGTGRLGRCAIGVGVCTF